jgi:hypothetical protein
MRAPEPPARTTATIRISEATNRIFVDHHNNAENYLMTPTLRSLVLIGLATVLPWLGAASTMAQDQRLDELQFDEEQITDEVPPYFAVGVGVLANVSFVQVSDVNARAGALQLDDISSPLLQGGFEVIVPLPFLSNLRGGFAWLSGTARSEKTIAVNNAPEQNAIDVTRTLEYSIGSSTAYVDYVLSPAKHVYIQPGLGFSWTTQTMTAYQGVGTVPYVVGGPISQDPAQFGELQRNVLALVPRLNIEFAATPFLNLRLNASYNLQISEGDWMMNRTSTVSGVPTTISTNAFQVQLGLFVGLFP